MFENYCEIGSEEKIFLGVSACLMGYKYRYDGGHKKDEFLMERVSKFFSFIPFCPEVEIGLTVPREPLRLEIGEDRIKMVFVKTKIDITEKMESYSLKKVNIIKDMNLSGVILKKDSPSCGMERVKVYNAKGVPQKNGIGIFAKILIEKFPLLPVEEEGRLNDPKLRENFFERVFAYHRLNKFFSQKWKLKDLIEFYTKEKFLIFAHDEKIYRELGKFVANIKSYSRDEIEQIFKNLFMNAMKKIATKTKNYNVLIHIYGFLKDKLTQKEKNELLEILDDYKKGFSPLIVPITLIKHHLLMHNIDYLLKQTYLSPSPKELMLRNYY